MYKLGEWRDRDRRSSVTDCPQKGNFELLVNQTAAMGLTIILLLVITQNLGHAAPNALSKEEVSNLSKVASINDVHKMTAFLPAAKPRRSMDGNFVSSD